MSLGPLLVPPWRLWLPIRERYRKPRQWLSAPAGGPAEQRQIRHYVRLPVCVGGARRTMTPTQFSSSFLPGIDAHPPIAEGQICERVCMSRETVESSLARHL